MTADKGNKFPFTSKEIQAIFGSDEGKRLIQILQTENGAVFEKAADLLKHGKVDQAMELLRPVAESNQTKALLDQINRNNG